MPPTVLRIVEEIDALLSIYDVPQTVPHTLARERHTRHRLQFILALNRLETPRFIRGGLEFRMVT
jgi:hypothetical protein